MPSTRRALTLTIAMTVLPFQVATAQSVQLDPADDSAPDEAPSLQATENRILHLEQQVEALDAMDPQIESLEKGIQALTPTKKTDKDDLEALNQRLSTLEASARAFIANTESRIEAMAERLGITAIPLDQSAIEAAERVAASMQQDEDASDTEATQATHEGAEENESHNPQEDA
ncbi:hypothetical protein [Halomonas elongata]|uniref:Uncharacterized protein n=1 Tax=Halomonas elongata (strain ATCC 33173 / DSM 2581 / NBRC 15536 / NCIMB 2198 / 1H9) TaxID=768066 RepID=E1VA40_HALED|nr:hypothetical protein [Halomonas elongata]WBF17669.1 hypothetical protein LM502_16575 [Halomonas elongata]WPU46510.1 hypothetical protein SR933_14810 [Halomonas elongata DSM 2581]CBV43928.1 uncharacterized protein HELO_4044 [Halomonas elongata DSM 2581]